MRHEVLAPSKGSEKSAKSGCSLFHVTEKITVETNSVMQHQSRHDLLQHRQADAM